MSKQSSGVNGFICHVWFEGGGESSSFWDDLKTKGGAIRRAEAHWPRSERKLYTLKDGERTPLASRDITCGGLLAITFRHDGS